MVSLCMRRRLFCSFLLFLSFSLSFFSIRFSPFRHLHARHGRTPSPGIYQASLFSFMQFSTLDLCFAWLFIPHGVKMQGKSNPPHDATPKRPRGKNSKHSCAAAAVNFFSPLLFSPLHGNSHAESESGVNRFFRLCPLRPPPKTNSQ